jgi:hypothetical protein
MSRGSRMSPTAGTQRLNADASGSWLASGLPSNLVDAAQGAKTVKT